MLLTLAAGSLTRRLAANGEAGLNLLDVPRIAIEQLQLRGLNVPASLLAGWSVKDLDRLRDQADKAGCPCLVLVEDTPLAFADPDESVRDAAGERVKRVAVAANRLGCNAIAIQCDAADTDEAFELTAMELREVMPDVERHELNLLLGSNAGLTLNPDRLTDLIKRVGGFRIGSLPDFQHAAASGDAVAALRKLAPYAGAVHATILGFDKKGVHKSYSLEECVTAIRSVGFVNTLAIDFTGDDDPMETIERARSVLQQAIDAYEG